MKTWFTNLSIRHKLIVLCLLTSGIVLLLASAGFLVYDQFAYRRQMIRDLSITAEMTGYNSASAIAFNDSVSAARTLQGLATHPNLTAACIFGQDGAIFARYQRASDLVGFESPPGGYVARFDDDGDLDIFLPILSDGEMIGTLFLRSDLRGLHARLWRFSLIAGVVLLISLLLAYSLAARLQGVISGPILELAAVATRVANEKAYGLRAVERGNDEVGRLIDGFNGMLDQIQLRDAALQAAHHGLELRVEERTAELARAQARFKFIFDSVPVGIALVDEGETRLHLVNPAHVRITGVSAADSSQPGVFARATHPDDYRRQLEAMQPFVRGEVDRYSFEKRYLHPDGRAVWVVLTSLKFSDPSTGTRQAVTTLVDITERKRAEESLQLLSSAVEQSKESIMITDAQVDLPGPNIVFVNPAYTRMTGYSAAESVGKNPRILQGPRTDRAVLDRLRRNLERGEVFAGEAINYRKDGTEFYLEWQIAPIRNAAGTITHFVALQRDVTARKQFEVELASAQRQLVDASRKAGMAEVATGVLHNVGNVLNSVNVSATLVLELVRHSKAANVAKLAALFAEHQAGLAEFLTRDPRGQMIPAYLVTLTDSLAEEQKAVTAELDHLRKNIDHIKDIVAMQQSYAKNSGVIESVALTDLVEDALRMNASSLARHDVEVVRDFQARPVISTDKHKIVQILINLVRNARFACDDSGRTDKRITVRTTADDRTVSIAVIDNGVGIPAENLTRIFAHGFTTRKTGHGFGLHSGALAAKELGGAIRVASDGLGTGATFTLELPFTMRSANSSPS